MAADERRVEGLAFALRDPYPWADLATLARVGESIGYRALFLPEVGSRDVLAALTGLAGETRSLLLASGAADLYRSSRAEGRPARWRERRRRTAELVHTGARRGGGCRGARRCGDLGRRPVPCLRGGVHPGLHPRRRCERGTRGGPDRRG